VPIRKHRQCFRGNTGTDIAASGNPAKAFLSIEAKVIVVEPELVITRLEIDMVPCVKVSQISRLSKDPARGLLVISVHAVDITFGKLVIRLKIPDQHCKSSICAICAKC
jgi:hypothetical protein